MAMRLGIQGTYQQTLLRACMVLRDEVTLAERLGVPVERVVDWLVGSADVPAEVFLQAVDIVLGATKKQVQDVKAFLEGIRARHSARPARRASRDASR